MNLSDDMREVEQFFHKTLSLEINWRRVTVSHNDIAWFIDVQQHPAKQTEIISKLVNKLPSTIGYFKDEGKNRHVFGPIKTNHQKYKFAELKAGVIGTHLLEKKKEALEIMKQFSGSLKELAAMKKEFNITE